MWVASGFDPDTFWAQTPGTFQIVMEGVRKRLQRERDDRIALAWETAAFTRTERLKPLKQYLGNGPAKRQAPSEMLAALRAFQAAGANMTIRRVPHPTGPCIEP